MKIHLTRIGTLTVLLATPLLTLSAQEGGRPAPGDRNAAISRRATDRGYETVRYKLVTTISVRRVSCAVSVGGFALDAKCCSEFGVTAHALHGVRKFSSIHDTAYRSRHTGECEALSMTMYSTKYTPTVFCVLSHVSPRSGGAERMQPLSCNLSGRT